MSAEASIDPARRPIRARVLGSRLGRLIIALNALGLAVLVVGALVLNEFGPALIQARVDSLSTQSDLISYVIVGAATQGEPEPSLHVDDAVKLLTLLDIPMSERARLYDRQGHLLADTDVIADKVTVGALSAGQVATASTSLNCFGRLAPARPPGKPGPIRLNSLRCAPRSEVRRSSKFGNRRLGGGW